MVNQTLPSWDQLAGVRGLLLDLDNTLYPYEPSHRAGLVAAQQSLAVVFPTVDSLAVAYAAARVRVAVDCRGQGASHSRFLYFQKLLEQRLGRSDIGLTLNAHRAYWDAFSQVAVPVAGVLEFLATCRERAVKTCILTDLTAEVQFRKLASLGLSNAVDFVVTSEEAGVEKPHPYPFYLALEKLGLRPSDVAMIGDDPEKDGKGAQLLGIPWHRVYLGGAPC